MAMREDFGLSWLVVVVVPVLFVCIGIVVSNICRCAPAGGWPRCSRW
jgi:hypothetical protein